MEAATVRLRELARRIVDEALARVELRAALLAGSAGRGDADEWSDIDLLVYVDELPPAGALEELRLALGGGEPRPKGRHEGETDGIEFVLEGVHTEVSYHTVAAVERVLEGLLVDLTELDQPWQKLALGLLEGLALEDDGTIEGWRARLEDFPDPLRRALIELHWRGLFPLWHWVDSLDARDCELFRLEMLVDGMLRLLGILAALNRVYYSRFHLKRVGELIAAFAVAPSNLKPRLDALPGLPPREAADDLAALALETRELVRAALPDLELPFRFPPGTRQQPFLTPERD
jgi:predicted nucleotidyltransferase